MHLDAVEVRSGLIDQPKMRPVLLRETALEPPADFLLQYDPGDVRMLALSRSGCGGRRPGGRARTSDWKACVMLRFCSSFSFRIESTSRSATPVKWL